MLQNFADMTTQTSSNPHKSANGSLLIQLAGISQPKIIKVIGVGGGGGNAVGQMYRDNIPEVNYLVVNTDSKALRDSPVPNQLQIGPGLGAGGDPEKGRKLGEENLSLITDVLDSETEMVFITAGMGGGTGTGISPLIAREARKKHILTVGIVTIPFLFEREIQINKALDGLEALSKEVDAMLVINNQRLCEIYPELSVIDAFKRADETLSNAVSSITEIISMHGRINLDFEDVRNVLSNGGIAVMSSGYGEGGHRVNSAIQDALHSPLLNNNDVYSADRILIAITTSNHGNEVLKMGEIDEITAFTQQFDKELNTKWGLAFDDQLGNKLKITILASGFNLYSSQGQADRKPKGIKRTAYSSLEDDKRRHCYYGNCTKGSLYRQSRTYIFNDKDLLNPQVLELVEHTPTRLRTNEQIQAIRKLSKSSQ